MRIEITRADRDAARDCARRRQEFNKDTGDAYGLRTGNGEKVHRRGCLSELIVSRLLDQEWHEFSEDFKNLPGDIGDGIQIRSTEHPRGNLILHPKDKDTDVFILVKLELPNAAEVVGWVLGTDAKQDKYWKEPQKGRPCFLYPAKLLNPDLSDLAGGTP